MKTVHWIPALGLLSLPTLAQDKDDWPHFMGPNQTAQVAAIESSFDWGEEGPEILWRTKIGKGYGGPAIRDGQVFLLDREVGQMDILRVLDLETGEDLWDYGYEAPGRLMFPGSRTVPAVTEKLVFATGGQGHVIAIDRASKDVKWETHSEEIYGGRMPTFGWSNSPLVVGDKVIVAALGEDVGLVAFDAESGEEVWVTEGVGYSHSSPVLLELLGKEQILFLSTAISGTGEDEPAPMTISSFDPETGDLLWQTVTLLTRLAIPAPVKIDDEHLFLTGGYRSGSKLLKISQEEGKVQFEEIFRIDRGAQVHVPVLHDGHLYMIVNENWNDPRNLQSEGGLMCLTLDGEEKWRTKNDPYFGRGNIMLVGDHLVIQDGVNGTLRVVEASPEAYRPIAEANLYGIDDRRDHQMWAPMALSKGLLVLRSQDEMLCVRL